MKKSLITLLIFTMLISACAAPKPAEAENTDPFETPTADVEREPEPVPEPETHVVEDNGGYFVSVDGKVWFRRFTDASYADTVLFGTFFGSETPAEDEVWYYDIGGDALVMAFSESGGTGPMWYSGGGFFMKRYVDNEKTELFHVFPEGNAVSWGNCTICGVSDDTDYAAVYTSNAEGAYIGVIKCAETKVEHFTEEITVEFCGFAGSKSIWLNGNKIVSIDGDTGELLEIGTIPVPEFETYSPEIDCFRAEGDEFAIVLGWYDGTGHYLQESVVLAGKASDEDSLWEATDEPIIGGVTAAELTELAYFEPVTLSGVTYGDLLYYDNPKDTEPAVLIDDFIPYFGDNYGGEMLQTAEIIGDGLYIAVADTFRAKADDIGWRQAYGLYHMYYARVPVREESWAEYFFDDEPKYTAADVFIRFVGEWKPVVSETEGERTYPEYGEEDILAVAEDGTITLKSGEYENTFTETQIQNYDGEYIVTGNSGDEIITLTFDDGYLWLTVQDGEKVNFRMGCK